MTPDEIVTRQFQKANDILCARLVELLSPVTDIKGFSCDLLIRVRDGHVAVLPQPLYKGKGWEARYSNKPSAPHAGKEE